MILTCKILAVISLATYFPMHFEPEDRPPSNAMAIVSILNIFSTLALCIAIQLI